MPEREPLRYRLIPNRLLQLIGPLNLVLCLAIGARYELSKYITYEDMYPQDQGNTLLFTPLDEEVIDMEFAPGSSGFDNELVNKTVPVYLHAEGERNKVENKQVLAQVYHLSDTEVEAIFGITPSPDQYWAGVVNITTYPFDGGAEKIGAVSGHHAFVLTERGIQALSTLMEVVDEIQSSDYADIIKEDHHFADAEESIIFVVVIDGKLYFVGELDNNHGVWFYHPASDMYAYDDHPFHTVSIKKDTERPTIEECNSAQMSVRVNIIGVIKYTQEVLRDRCVTLDEGFIDRPEIPPQNIVGSRDHPRNPFILNGKLVTLYHAQENPWRIDSEGIGHDNHFCGWDEDLNNGEGGQSPDCRAEFYWLPAWSGKLQEALAAIPDLKPDDARALSVVIFSHDDAVSNR